MTPLFPGKALRKLINKILPMQAASFAAVTVAEGIAELTKPYDVL